MSITLVAIIGALLVLGIAFWKKPALRRWYRNGGQKFVNWKTAVAALLVGGVLAVAGYHYFGVDSTQSVAEAKEEVERKLAPTPKAAEPRATPEPTAKPASSTNETMLAAKPVKKPAPVVKTASAGVFHWRNFGADPFASSREEAMGKREQAFRAMGLSEACVAEAMRVTKTTGSESELRVGDRLDAMLSGKAGAHKNVLVDFPRGIKASTEEWSLTCDGKTYRLVLPEVCYNWSLATGPSRSLGGDECVELTFGAPTGGNVRWGVGSVSGPLPPSSCNAQREGDGPWVAWWGECDWCEPAYGYIRSVLGESAEVPHKYLYPAKESQQTIRFSAAVQSRLVYVCLEDQGGAQSCGVYVRPEDWKGRRVIEIPDTLWRFDAECS